MNAMRIVGRTDIALYWPKLYRGFVEAEEIQNAENLEFDRLAKIIMLILQNSKLSKCDRDTLEAYEVAFHFEDLYGETYQWGYSGPSPDELGDWADGTTQAQIDAYNAELEKFRSFVIARIRSHKKWPLFYVLAYLDANTSGYSLTIDYDGFLIYFTLTDETELSAVAKFLQRVKPMNLALDFIKDFSISATHNICISTDALGGTGVVWNYVLDGSWTFADEKPFKSIADGPSIWDLTEEISVSSTTLNVAALSIADQSDSGIVNDTLDCHEVSESVVGSSATIKFSAPYAPSVPTITKVGVLNSSNEELLFQDGLSIPSTGETTFVIKVTATECGKTPGILYLDGTWLLDGTRLLDGIK